MFQPKLSKKKKKKAFVWVMPIFPKGGEMS